MAFYAWHHYFQLMNAIFGGFACYYMAGKFCWRNTIRSKYDKEAYEIPEIISRTSMLSIS